MDVDEQSQASDGQGAARKPPPLAPGLHIVATPIGNLRDITLRALDVLRAADLIACEDTRVFAKLASHYGISVPTVAYSDATQDLAEPRIVRALAAGKRVALVSDAGMPLISDPGYRLVRAALAGGHAVTSAPGPSAVPMALALSGLPTDRFYLRRLPAGPRRRPAPRHRRRPPACRRPWSSSRRRTGCRNRWSISPIFWARGPPPSRASSPSCSRRSAARRSTELAAHYAAHPDVKGEIVIVIGPPGEAGGARRRDALDEALRTAMAGASVKDAASEVAARFGLKRRDVYARALELKREASS